LAVPQFEGGGAAGSPLLLAALQIRRGNFQKATALLDTVKQRWGQTWPHSATVTEQARRYFEHVAELQLWQGRLQAAGAAIRDGLTAVAGTDDQRFSGQLLWLGMRAAADRAQQHGPATTKTSSPTLNGKPPR
jgi:hypothetical protein